MIFLHGENFGAGCGSGKYLNLNPVIFSVGADRCRALTEIAREKDNEVKISFILFSGVWRGICIGRVCRS